jgi:NRPS condensation-like uncharacterized protein
MNDFCSDNKNKNINASSAIVINYYIQICKNQGKILKKTGGYYSIKKLISEKLNNSVSSDLINRIDNYNKPFKGNYWELKYIL